MESPRTYRNDRLSVYKRNRSISQELASCNIVIGKAWTRARPQHSNVRYYLFAVSVTYSESYSAIKSILKWTKSSRTPLVITTEEKQKSFARSDRRHALKK